MLNQLYNNALFFTNLKKKNLDFNIITVPSGTEVVTLRLKKYMNDFWSEFLVIDQKLHKIIQNPIAQGVVPRF